MGFWAKSIQICKCLCENGKQSIRDVAHRTGFSKSSVHRLQQAMERRDLYPESRLWETEEGRTWLVRLVVATIYTFGFKRGVGAETMSEYFVRLHLEEQVGCSPNALRGVMKKLEPLILETAKTWESEASAHGEVRDIIGAVDETFLEYMMLVLMDLHSGYILLEEVAEDRTYKTWKALVDERLATLKSGILYLVSDRAKALIQLAEKGFGCLSIPDFFHLVHELVKSYSLSIGRRLKQAQKALDKAEGVLEKAQRRSPGDGAAAEALCEVEVCRQEVGRWQEVQRTYRHHLLRLSLIMHPFNSDDSTAQTAKQVEDRLQAEVTAIEALVDEHELPARPDAMKKVYKQLPALAALVAFWWQGVAEDLEPMGLSPQWRQWALDLLLPLVYWQYQVAHTSCASRRARMQEALEALRLEFAQHRLTQQLAPEILKDWQEWATQQVKAFQRTSSAVEGRNGYLSGMHHNQRGLSKERYPVWTVVYNFDCRASDGTTPAARFFGRSFPDLFETVLAGVGELPRPRRRTCEVGISH